MLASCAEAFGASEVGVTVRLRAFVVPEGQRELEVPENGAVLADEIDPGFVPGLPVVAYPPRFSLTPCTGSMGSDSVLGAAPARRRSAAAWAWRL